MDTAWPSPIAAVASPFSAALWLVLPLQGRACSQPSPWLLIFAPVKSRFVTLPFRVRPRRTFAALRAAGSVFTCAFTALLRIYFRGPVDLSRLLLVLSFARLSIMWAVSKLQLAVKQHALSDSEKM